MTDYTERLPQYVKDSIEARIRGLDAPRRKLCVYDDYSQPAARARGGRAARCMQHDLEEFGEPITPDPERTIYALRAKHIAAMRAAADIDR